jgi:hypothetical protein
MWQWHWKLFHSRTSKIIPTVTESLDKVHNCSKGVLQRWSLSVNCMYT